MCVLQYTAEHVAAGSQGQQQGGGGGGSQGGSNRSSGGAAAAGAGGGGGDVESFFSDLSVDQIEQMADLFGSGSDIPSHLVF